MANARMGAFVAYCGHEGAFVADIHRVGNANVVVANGPVTPDNIDRKNHREATHHISDHLGGYWNPRKGIFVVPGKAVRIKAGGRFVEERRNG